MTNKRFFRNTLGAVVATLSLGIFTETTASADEGMWLPSLIAERIGDMQSKGFKLSAEDIYSVNQASLKDAVVLFGSGCTGEVISPRDCFLPTITAATVRFKGTAAWNTTICVTDSGR